MKLSRGLASAFDLACSTLAAAAWYIKPDLGPWPLLILGFGRLVRAWASGRAVFRRTPFTWPLLLLLLSAGVSAWLAYDRGAALAKFWLILAGVALYDSLAQADQPVHVAGHALSPVRILLALLPALLAIYFLLTNDWNRWMGKFQALDALMAWLKSWQPQLPGHRLHPNVAGGLIAAFIPLQIAALSGGRILRGRFWAIPLLAISVLGLVLTASRGAWVALLAAGTAWWLLRLNGRRTQRKTGAGNESRAPDRAGMLLRASLAPVVVLVLAAGPLSSLFGSFGSRLDLLHNSLDLAGDYPFTGMGLGGFEMAYSSYVLLLHVGYIVHSHNLLLNVWIEQGLFGLAALVWMVVLAFHTVLRRSSGRVLAVGALAALAVILLHGLVDDAFYGSRAVLLLFVPFGVVAQQAAAGGPRAPDAAPSPPHTLRRTLALSLVAGIVLGSLLLPGVRAAFQANLGAVLQTRQELSRYSWPAWGIQDELRRSPEVDLGPALARYQAALEIDPANVTANRRLGQIALSLGQYDRAQVYLETAYHADPAQRATRQLLGESYAVAGNIDQAAALWRTVDTGSGQLDARAWWYDHLGEKQRAAWIKQAAEAAGR